MGKQQLGVKTNPELPFAGNVLNFLSARDRYRVDVPGGRRPCRQRPGELCSRQAPR